MGEHHTVPTYPGVIPYQIDHQREEEEIPRLLGMERRPQSTGPPSSSTVLGYRTRENLTEEEARDKFYSYWERQTSGEGWLAARYTRSEQSNSSSNTASPGGSQAALLSTKVKKQKWPHSLDFLASSWAFTLSLHSVWFFPISLLQHGGLVFLLMYAALLVLLGGPILLLEMFLGQYSGLAPVRLYRHLCPLLTGLGLTVCVLSLLRMVLDLAVVTWAGQSLFLLFSQQSIRDGFFYRDVLNKDNSDLAELGSISGQLSLILGIGAVLTFILVAAGTKSLGKVCMVIIPLMYMLLVSLVIRSCLADGGLAGLTTLLSPDWSKLTSPLSWLEATCQVVFSLQLGLGAITTYSSYNKFNHNFIRDSLIVVISHLVWTLLCVLLILSLLGVAHNNQAINLGNLATDPALVSITGKGIWLISITLVETSLSSISYGWLWAGLFFVFLLLVAISSIFGYLEMLATTLVNLRPSLLPYKPALSFGVLAVVYLIDLFMATQGGVHVYHLLHTYLYQWPLLLVTLLTVLPVVLCHGTRNVMKDIGNMTKIDLPHFVTSHLSVLYYTVVPALSAAALCYSLYMLAMDHLLDPLATFSISLPQEWGMPLGWALTFLPLSPILFAGLVHLTFGARGIPKRAHLRRSVLPSDRYYRNEHLELTTDAAKKYTNSVSVV